MLTLLLGVAAASPTAVDAEREFAKDAQAIGQWTTFRKWSTSDAVMFTPQAVWAHRFLKDKKNPARSVEWWPERVISSCDGRTAVTTGPWLIAANKATGGFTTVWQHRPEGWRWVYDAGDQYYKTGKAPAKVRLQKASCRGKPSGPPIIPVAARAASEPANSPGDSGAGLSADKTLGWDWKVEANGTRHFRVYRWNGRRYLLALNQKVAPE